MSIFASNFSLPSLFSWLPNIELGSRRDDTIRGTDGRDKLFGLHGDDTFYGSAGSDMIAGGRGFESHSNPVQTGGEDVDDDDDDDVDDDDGSFE